MTEYFTKGLVLSRDDRGEFDGVFSIYTKDFGKIRATARSVRRIKSKLSPHLSIGNFADLRIIKNNNYQIVDAFSFDKSKLNQRKLKFIEFIEQMTPDESQDHHLWYGIDYVLSNNLIGKGGSDNDEFEHKIYRRFLEIFGFGAKFARCGNCGSKDIVYFIPPDIMFLCLKSSRFLAIKEEDAIKI
ncbi:MAG TPA: DNA repair protein RecO [Candidatus Paceibacterota bacterium]